MATEPKQLARVAELAKTRLSESARGEINANTAYPLSVFTEKTGLGRKAVKVLCRRGMPVRRAGRQIFIIGADFIQALKGE